MSNAIVDENALAGTTAWRLNASATIEIQSYTDATSYNPGDTVSFHVSTQNAGTTYSIDIYRIGWYSGKGARLIDTISGRTGTAQGYYNLSNTTLTNCPSAIIDNTTKLTEAGWTITDTWTVPNNACTGYYQAKFTDANGKQTLNYFIVKSTTPGDYAMIRSFTTDCAYNSWGGYSLYTNPSVAALKVSLNRPSFNNGGASNENGFSLPLIHWVESQGYNLSYLSNIDVHATPSILLNYKVLMSFGHDEYWSKSMRDGWEAAIAAGVSAAFLGGNGCYWQIRMENDNAGNPNRTVVCYKVGSAGTGSDGHSYGPGTLANDPMYGVNNAIVTCQWRDPVVNRPENTMIGIMYSQVTTGSNAAWTTDASMDTTYTAGTGLVANTSYGSDLTGYEWDNIHTGSPSGLKTIGTSPISGPFGSDHSNTTFYRASSGALVFASGSIAWTWSLDTFRSSGSVIAVVPQIQVLFANIMGALKGPVFSVVSL